MQFKNITGKMDGSLWFWPYTEWKLLSKYLELLWSHYACGNRAVTKSVEKKITLNNLHRTDGFHESKRRDHVHIQDVASIFVYLNEQQILLAYNFLQYNKRNCFDKQWQHLGKWGKYV